MNQLFNIGFRNIFRNTSRSILTILIVMISVIILLFGNSFIGGFLKSILYESIKFTGNIRITTPDYKLREKTMSLLSNIDDYQGLRNQISQDTSLQKNLKNVVGRIKFGTVVYHGDLNKECQGFGIEPKDNENLSFQNSVYQGRVIKGDSKDEVIVGRKVAESLNLKLNDEITLLVKTLNNSSYALNFRVVGFFDMQSGRLNRTLYISLPAAQLLLDMEGRVTELLVFGQSTDDTSLLMNRLKSIPQLNGFQLEPWDQIGVGPAFVKIVNIVASTILLIITILAGISIANTMMMAIYERTQEVGMLKSMGMHNREIVSLFTIEGIILGLFGSILGILIGGFLSYQVATKGINLGNALKGLPFVIKEIIYGEFNLKIFIQTIILSSVVSILASLLPSFQSVKLTPVEALRNN